MSRVRPAGTRRAAVRLPMHLQLPDDTAPRTSRGSCATSGCRSKAETGPIVVGPIRLGVVRRRTLDLVLGQADRHAVVLEIDPIDHACRKDDLLPEDPRACVDDDVRGAELVGGLTSRARTRSGATRVYPMSAASSVGGTYSR